MYNELLLITDSRITYLTIKHNGTHLIQYTGCNNKVGRGPLYINDTLNICT